MLRLLLLSFLTVLMSGCDTDSPQSSPTVKLTVATEGVLPLGASLAGIGFKLSLPAGVMPVLNAEGQVVDSTLLVTPSSLAAKEGLEVAVVYQAPNAEQPARLSLVVASKAMEGVGVGEIMVLNFKRPPDTRYLASDFIISDFRASDLGGHPVDNLKAIITAVKLE